MNKVTEDIAKAFERSVEALSLTELSRETGVRITTLRRFLNRRSRHIRQETMDKIYPAIRPYIWLARNPDAPRPARLGSAPRRGHYLDALISDEKVLLDTFSSLPDERRQEIIAAWSRDAAPGTDKYQLAELSDQENRILSLFARLPQESREEKLFAVVDEATELLRRLRAAGSV